MLCTKRLFSVEKTSQMSPVTVVSPKKKKKLLTIRKIVMQLLILPRTVDLFSIVYKPTTFKSIYGSSIQLSVFPCSNFHKYTLIFMHLYILFLFTTVCLVYKMNCVAKIILLQTHSKELCYIIFSSEKAFNGFNVCLKYLNLYKSL